MTRRGLLLVAHGSRRQAANREVYRLTERLRASVRGRFGLTACAFLELAEPSVPAGLRALVEAGAGEIVVLPYFLAAGNHVASDIPAMIAAAQSEYPTVKLSLRPYLGASDGLVGLLAHTATADS